MTSTAFRLAVCVASIALIACTSDPLPMTSGQTTTTYGNTVGSSSDDGDPGDVTDDGDPSADTIDPDPSDDGPNPTDDSDDGPDPSDSDGGIWDIGGNPNGAPDGSACIDNSECFSNNCYLIPFLGGFCGECTEDADCDGGGCTPPNPFDSIGSHCNIGEFGAGCESDEVCSPGLQCSTAFDLLGLIIINTCGDCLADADCNDQICAPIVDIAAFGGYNTCIDLNSLPQDSYCDLQGNGAEACMSGHCSVVDIMGLAQVGACGECSIDNDCGDNGYCQVGEFLLDQGELVGSTCQ